MAARLRTTLSVSIGELCSGLDQDRPTGVDPDVARALEALRAQRLGQRSVRRLVGTGAGLHVRLDAQDSPRPPWRASARVLRLDDLQLSRPSPPRRGAAAVDRRGARSPPRSRAMARKDPRGEDEGAATMRAASPTGSRMASPSLTKILRGHDGRQASAVGEASECGVQVRPRGGWNGGLHYRGVEAAGEPVQKVLPGGGRRDCVARREWRTVRPAAPQRCGAPISFSVSSIHRRPRPRSPGAPCPPRARARGRPGGSARRATATAASSGGVENWSSASCSSLRRVCVRPSAPPRPQASVDDLGRARPPGVQPAAAMRRSMQHDRRPRPRRRRRASSTPPPRRSRRSSSSSSRRRVLRSSVPRAVAESGIDMALAAARRLAVLASAPGARADLREQGQKRVHGAGSRSPAAEGSSLQTRRARPSPPFPRLCPVGPHT